MRLRARGLFLLAAGTSASASRPPPAVHGPAPSSGVAACRTSHARHIRLCLRCPDAIDLLLHDAFDSGCSFFLFSRIFFPSPIILPSGRPLVPDVAGGHTRVQIRAFPLPIPATQLPHSSSCRRRRVGRWSRNWILIKSRNQIHGKLRTPRPTRIRSGFFRTYIMLVPLG